jgi:hypothetical protein
MEYHQLEFLLGKEYHGIGKQPHWGAITVAPNLILCK